MLCLVSIQFIIKMEQLLQTFKSKVLNVVTGEFKLFKIPIPYGHIWDSFLRVFQVKKLTWSSAWFVHGFK